MKNLIKAFLECTALLAVALLIVFLFKHNTKANATDYHNHQLSEQICQEWQEQAKREWRQEYGDRQPNLTLETEKYLQKQTALLQKELDNGN